MYSSDMKTTILVLLYKNNLDHLLMKEYLLNFEGYWGAPDKPCGVGRADANPKLLLNDT